MARPHKTGLDYFPLDVDFFDDDKIKLVRAKHGERAALVVLRLFTKIYRQGYWYGFGENEQALLSLDMGAEEFPPTYTLLVVACCADVGVFDKQTFEKHQVLTGTAIQRRFLEITSRRKDALGKQPYWLLPSASIPKNRVNVDNNPINVDHNPINVVNNPQRKAKKRITNPTTTEGGGWRRDYEVYLAELRAAYRDLLDDKAALADRQKYHPNQNLELSLEKACTQFWATPEGWEHKKRDKKVQQINWRTTLLNSLNQPQNKVYNGQRKYETEPAETPVVVRANHH